MQRVCFHQQRGRIVVTPFWRWTPQIARLKGERLLFEQSVSKSRDCVYLKTRRSWEEQPHHLLGHISATIISYDIGFVRIFGRPVLILSLESHLFRSVTDGYIPWWDSDAAKCHERLPIKSALVHNPGPKRPPLRNRHLIIFYLHLIWTPHSGTILVHHAFQFSLIKRALAALTREGMVAGSDILCMRERQRLIWRV